MNLYHDIETENYCNYQNSLINMVNQILQQKFLKTEIGEFDVGNLFVENQPTNAFYYQCRSDSINQVNQDAENIWLAYFDFFFPPEDNFQIEKKLYDTLLNFDLNKVYFFFQKSRNPNSNNYRWYFSTSKLLIKDQPASIPILFRYAFELNKQQTKSKNLDEENYFQKYSNRFMLLSKREKEIIKLIVEGKSSIEISNILFISIHTVNNHRKNITNKLEINNLCQLTKFAIFFDIV
jgi:DNA-binding CsgD family transcriptional regulator